MITLYDSLNKQERYAFDKWRIMMKTSYTTLGVLYCEVRATYILRKAKKRILLEQLNNKYSS